MASLAIMLFERKLKDTCSPSIQTSNNLSLLNWLASCFVRESKGDRVATALSPEAGQITLLIALDRGKPTSEDRQSADAFLCTLQNALQVSNLSIKAQGMKFFKLAVAISYRRIDHKINLLTTMGNPKETVEERFERIVAQWAGCAASNIEQNPLFLRRIRQLSLEPLPGGPNGNDILILVFQKFVRCIRNKQAAMATKDSSTTHVLDPQDPEMDEDAKFFCLMATCLVDTDFFKQFKQDSNSKSSLCNKEDYDWIVKLQRRLRHLGCLSADADLFASRGLDFIRSALGQDGVAKFVKSREGIKIVWIGEQSSVGFEGHGASHTMVPSSPKLFLLNSFFKQPKWPMDAKTCQKIGDGEILNGIEAAYPEVINPKFHCEAQMITYLEHEKIQVHKNVIGTSELMCWSCNAYAKVANANRGEREKWVLTGTSNKPDYEWLIPPNPLGDAVVSLIQREFQRTLDRISVEDQAQEMWDRCRELKRCMMQSAHNTAQ